MADSKGTWLDTDNGKIVHSQPVNGRLLVAPGAETTAADKATIDRYEADFATKVDEVDPTTDASSTVQADEDDPKTVTTKTAKKASAKP